ncbi:MAG: hypothetical protein JXR76_27025 [Deltaproteobacteria bacterium]|nr:hypothetical protein [Deltaproteobacteria bacterium]
MTFVLRYLWLIPLVVHAGYFCATIPYFPQQVGEPVSSAFPRFVFSVEWIFIVLISNITLFWVWVKMPRFSDRVLSVPNREYWFQSKKNRAELVTRLQNLMETILVLVNIFLLGIFQWVYQSNVLSPVLLVPQVVIIGGFVAAPLSLILIYMLIFIRSLRKKL